MRRARPIKPDPTPDLADDQQPIKREEEVRKEDRRKRGRCE